MRQIVSSVLPSEGAASMQPDGKCGSKFSELIMGNWDRFTPAQQSQLRTLMSPESFDQVRLIGHFEIHYDTSGTNAPAMLDSHGNQIPNSVEQYIDSVLGGKLFDPVLSVHLKDGWAAVKPIHGYLQHDDESAGWAEIIQWVNPACPPPPEFDLRKLPMLTPL